jgi:hypothetical protein
MAENRLNSAGQAQLFINNAQKGVWFGNGTRDLSTAVIEPPKMQVFEIYPNPVESVLRVRTEDRLHRGAEATIYNLLGQPVHTAQIRNDSNSFDIPVDHLPAGAYFLSVRGDSIKGIMKFLKK